MDVEYIETYESEPIYIDESYYALLAPKPKPEVVVEARITLEYFNRVTNNTSPAKVDISTFDDYFNRLRS